MRQQLSAALAAAALTGSGLVACGGGEVLAVISFLGSAGGDWQFDDPAAAGFQVRQDCVLVGNPTDPTDDVPTPCVVNIQVDGVRSLFSTDFDVTFNGTLSDCPNFDNGRPDGHGTVRGDRIVLPGCFSGRYLGINEVVSDEGKHAFFDTEVPDLRTGVWVEIQDERRRYRFEDNPRAQADTQISGCELSTNPPTAVNFNVLAADLARGRTTTTITDFEVDGELWSGRFVGLSGIRLTRNGRTLELERRNLTSAACPP